MSSQSLESDLVTPLSRRGAYALQNFRDASIIRPEKDLYVEGLNLGGRRILTELFKQAPLLNAAIAVNSNLDFEVLGTNMTSALATFDPEGGITLTTAGASADQAILCPHLDTKQTAWSSMTWGTDQETHWRATIKTGAAITAMILWAGLKLTNTPTVITDDDQVFFRYEAGVNSGKWQCISSVAGTDTSADSGVTVATSTVYRLMIIIDSARVAKFYINGVLVATSAALTTAVDLIPYVGVQASAVAAKACTVRSISMSRNMA